MGLLSRLFGRKEAQATSETEVANQSCPHAAIVPCWDRATDIGKNALVASYVCDSCGATFTREEGKRLLSKAAERLKISDVERVERE